MSSWNEQDILLAQDEPVVPDEIKDQADRIRDARYYNQQLGIPADQAFDLQPELNEIAFGNRELAAAPGKLFVDAFKQSLAEKPAMILRGLTAYTPGKALGLDPLLDKAGTYLESLKDSEVALRLDSAKQGKSWPVGDERSWWQVEAKYLPEVINTWAANIGDQIPIMLITKAGQEAGKAIGKPMGAALGAGSTLVTGAPMAPDPFDVATAPAVVGITQQVMKHLVPAGLLVGMETGGFLDAANEIKGANRPTDPDLAEKYGRLYGAGSGAIEYAQWLWVLGRYSKIAKKAQDGILKTVLTHIGGSAFEGLEEFSQTSLQNWLVGKMVADMKARYPDYTGEAPAITEGARRDGWIATGVAALTGLPGTGMTVAEAARARMAKVQPQTKKFLGEPSVQEVQNAAEEAGRTVAPSSPAAQAGTIEEGQRAVPEAAPAGPESVVVPKTVEKMPVLKPVNKQGEAKPLDQVTDDEYYYWQEHDSKGRRLDSESLNSYVSRAEHLSRVLGKPAQAVVGAEAAGAAEGVKRPWEMTREELSQATVYHASHGPLEGVPRTGGNGLFLAFSSDAAREGGRAGGTFPDMGISFGTPETVTEFQIAPEAKVFGKDASIAGETLPETLTVDEYDSLLQKIKNQKFSQDERINKKAQALARMVLSHAYVEDEVGILRKSSGPVEQRGSKFVPVSLIDDARYAPDWEGFEFEKVMPNALRALGYDAAFVRDEAGLSVVALTDKALTKSSPSPSSVQPSATVAPEGKQAWGDTDAAIAEAKRQAQFQLPREGQSPEAAAKAGSANARILEGEVPYNGGYLLVDVPTEVLSESERHVDAARQKRLTDIGGSNDPVFIIDYGITDKGKPILVVDNGNNRVRYAKEHGIATVKAYINRKALEEQAAAGESWAADTLAKLGQPATIEVEEGGEKAVPTREEFARQVEANKGNRPEVSRPTVRDSVQFQTRTMNGPKTVRAKRYWLPGYDGPSIAVAETKSAKGMSQPKTYWVYLADSGTLIENSHGAGTLEDTLKIAIQRLRNIQSKGKSIVDYAYDEMTWKPTKPLPAKSQPATIEPVAKERGVGREEPVNLTEIQGKGHDKSVRDLPQSAQISSGSIRVTSKISRMTAGKISIPVQEWLNAYDFANPNYTKSELIRKYTQEMDEQPGGPEQAERIRDSMIYAIDKAFKDAGVDAEQLRKRQRGIKSPSPRESGAGTEPVEVEPVPVQPGPVLGGPSGGIAWHTHLRTAIEKSQELRPEIEEQQAESRSKRAKNYKALLKQYREQGVSGEEAMRRAQAAMSGPQADYQRFEPLDTYMTPEQIQNSYNDIADSTSLRPYEKVVTRRAFDHLRAGLVLPPHEIKALKKWRPELADILDKRLKTSPIAVRIASGLEQILGLLKFSASFDVQMRRQARWLRARHPELYAKAVGKNIMAYVSAKYAQKMALETRKNKQYKVAKKHGVVFLKKGEATKDRPEQFISHLGEKIPILGKGYAASMRGFVDSFNWLQMQLWNHKVNAWKRQGREITAKDLDELAEFNNTFLGVMPAKSYFGRAARRVLAPVMWSPTLTWSRVRSPEMILTNKAMRGETAVTLASYIGSGVMYMAAASFIALLLDRDDPVAWNPTSSEFGKIRVGDTRIDVFGDGGPFIRALIQFIWQTKTNQAGRARRDVGLQPIKQFLRNKRAPFIDLIAKIWTGRNYYGGPAFELPDWAEMKEEGGIKELVAKAGETITEPRVGEIGYFITRDLLVSPFVPFFVQGTIEASWNDGWPIALWAGGEELFSGSVLSYKPSDYTRMQLIQDQSAVAKYDKLWEDLTPREQTALRREVPEIDDLEEKAAFERLPPEEINLTEQNETSKRITKSLPDSVRRELDSVQLRIGGLSRKQGDFWLNDRRYEAYEKLVTDELNKRLPGIIESRAWENRQPEAKKKTLEHAVDSVKSMARSKLRLQIERGDI